MKALSCLLWFVSLFIGAARTFTYRHITLIKLVAVLFLMRTVEVGATDTVPY